MARKKFDPNLIPLPEPEGPETVWQFTGRVRGVLEGEFPDCWVLGEISNFKRHSSGHLFFTLKDDRASLRCVMWKSVAGRAGPEIADGVEVEARGHIGVFEAAGNYQLYVDSIRPRGLGRLEVAFRQLKEKLEKEGLFAAARKRPLPRYPRRVGVVTSLTGAAVRDIIHVLSRRWPAVEIVLAAARVQGEGAAAEIVAGIRGLNRLGGIDVMIIGRGGGSLEDLWPFNEEIVARAVAASAVPVVSAVGHETDFSISDFVADVRAPTPSAAAEMVVPDRREVRAALESVQSRLGRSLRHRLERMKDGLALFEGNRYFRYPQEMVLKREQRIDDLSMRLSSALRDGVSRLRFRMERAAGGLAQHAPHVAYEAAAGSVKMLAFRLAAAEQTLLEHRWKARVDRLAGRLEDLNPDRVLARGYSRTVLERTGGILTRAADVLSGDLLRTHLADGSVESRVTDGEVIPRPPAARPREGKAKSHSGKSKPNTGPTLFE